MDHGIHRLSTRGKVKITDYHTSETSVSAPKITLLEPRVNKYPRQIFNGIQRIQGGPVKKKNTECANHTNRGRIKPQQNKRKGKNGAWLYDSGYTRLQKKKKVN